MTDTIDPPNSPAHVAVALGTALPSTNPGAGVSSATAPVAAGISSIPPGTAQAVSSAFSASNVVADIKADVSKATSELSFVRANWGKLSIVVVALAVIVVILARCV
jgi:hypothetical protein